MIYRSGCIRMPASLIYINRGGPFRLPRQLLTEAVARLAVRPPNNEGGQPALLPPRPFGNALKKIYCSSEFQVHIVIFFKKKGLFYPLIYVVWFSSSNSKTRSLTLWTLKPFKLPPCPVLKAILFFLVKKSSKYL